MDKLASKRLTKYTISGIEREMFFKNDVTDIPSFSTSIPVAIL